MSVLISLDLENMETGSCGASSSHLEGIVEKYEANQRGGNIMEASLAFYLLGAHNANGDWGLASLGPVILSTSCLLSVDCSSFANPCASLQLS